MMKIDLTGRIALVTGGASGIGRGAALELARNGAAVVVTDRNAAGCDIVRDEIVAAGGVAIAIPTDVADPASVQAAVDATLERFHALDILVHSAGVSPRLSVVDMTDDEWHRVIAINLDGTMYVTRAVARAMLPRMSGTMIVIASDRGLLGQANKSAYAASKGGVIAFVKSLALEMGPHGITVNGINPGSTDTPLLRAEMPAALWESRLKTDPLGKMSTSEDIGEMVLFLAGSAGRFMTGQILTTRMRFG
jgi:NAD(P)-dependent dehydrogenase (short-subunit alcohol dehydrogenase family)